MARGRSNGGTCSSPETSRARRRGGRLLAILSRRNFGRSRRPTPAARCGNRRRDASDRRPAATWAMPNRATALSADRRRALSGAAAIRGRARQPDGGRARRELSRRRAGRGRIGASAALCRRREDWRAQRVGGVVSRPGTRRSARAHTDRFRREGHGEVPQPRASDARLRGSPSTARWVNGVPSSVSWAGQPGSTLLNIALVALAWSLRDIRRRGAGALERERAPSRRQIEGARN